MVRQVSQCQKIVPKNQWKATPRVLQRVDGFSRKLDRPKHYREQIEGYGNAIVPQLAAEFILAWKESNEHESKVRHRLYLCANRETRKETR
jgi:hypothetical protein